MFSLLFIFCFVRFTFAQIGLTVCTATGTECSILPNAICDQFNTLTCVCSGAQKYQAKPDKSGCDYNCGALTNPTNGAVSTTGTLQTSIATYTCNAGFKLTGVSTRTCVLGSGWSDLAPTCVAGKVGDSCATVTNLCVNLINAPCTGGVCTCLVGYTQSNDNECTEINECGSSPCMNGGTCANEIAKFTCRCPTGFNGTRCETNPNDCISAPCLNGGACADGLAAYTCTCLAGYMGTTCATNINECSSTPCQNGAVCNDGVNGYTCTCAAGFTGILCETNINECISNPCKNGATCNDAVNRYTCTCAVGFTGTHCETNIDDCASNPCRNGGICTDGIAKYTCTCASGYTGINCETNINECESIPCKNGASCLDKVAGYTCTCVAGYTGTLCETDINECTSNPCKNGATCNDLVNLYTCVCAPGYSGPTCVSDINECASNPCQNFGTCHDLVNGFNCTCVSGYNGHICQNNIDECAAATCLNGGTCNDGINKFTCSCKPGYTGTLCETNINECTTAICQNGGSCVDQVNSYICNCVSGYTGTHCETNINECTGHKCENGATCLDGIARYTCECAPGYNGTLCQNNINECVGHTICQNGATCVDIVNGFTCTCVNGFTGVFCQSNINDCSPNPCLNGGACTDLVYAYKCTCLNGYTGSTCATDINDCSPDPCVYGTCTDKVFDYTCTCSSGYSGKNCSTDVNECLSSPCRNGGTCTDIVNGYFCRCAAGYEGVTCLTDSNECLTSLCRTGATCVDRVNGYICQCAPGYTGQYCDQDINECLSHQCQNSATCVDKVNTYTCTCKAGYSGNLCEIDVNDCSPNPCQNGGTCTDRVNGFTCACADGYTGTTCSPATLNNDCSTRPGVCSNILKAECDGSKCSCINGYYQTGSITCSKKDCYTIVPAIYGTVNHAEGTLYEAKAYFSCETGYNRVGFPFVTCLANQTWNGQTPICVIKDCNTLSKPLNGSVTFVPNTEYLSQAEFECDIGYSLSGNKTRTCTDTGRATGVWAGTSPTCVIKDCGALTAPGNGTVDTQTGTKYQSVALFYCNTGYDLIGVSSTKCGADGVWDSVKPRCHIKDCLSLAAPANGNVNLPHGTTFNATAAYTCHTGYTLNGIASRICQSTGLWSNSPPTCEINTCTVLSNPTNGKVDLSNGTKYQSTAVYTCNSGFLLSGTTSRTCQADRTWASTDPICNRISCPTLTAPTNGAVDLSDGLLYEDIATFTCQTGYAMVGTSSRQCLATKLWSGESPTCQIRTCVSLTNPENGIVLTVDGTEYLKTAQYSCDQGYKISGVSTRTCSALGTWTASAPTCIILDCGPVANITHGTVTYSPANSKQYGSTVYYTCRDGYEIKNASSSSRVCLPSGLWSGTQPSCTILSCDEAPNVPNGYSWLPSGSQVGDYAMYACDRGYGLIGNPSVVCEPSGFWGAVPECRLDCGNAPLIANGVVTVPDGSLVGKNATYSCNNGYEVSGDATILCTTSGVWAESPRCVLIQNVYNTLCAVTAQCKTKGATCRDDTMGQDRCLCALTGQYFDSLQDKCLSICEPLPNPTNGIATNPSVLAEGHKATYTCFIGYALNGPGTRYCLSTGQWDSTAPLCITGCPAPLAPSHGSVNASDGLAAGDIIKYTCDEGYALLGVQERICGWDSKWSAGTPSCVIECPLLDNIPNGYVDMSLGNWVGSKATYICTNNHALVGISTRTCESTGVWSNVVPTCVFAIFPDVILVFGTLFVVLVLVDIFVISVCLYYRYCKTKPKPPPVEPKKVVPDVLDDYEDPKELDSFKMGPSFQRSRATVPEQPNPVLEKKDTPFRTAVSTNKILLPVINASKAKGSDNLGSERNNVSKGRKNNALNPNDLSNREVGPMPSKVRLPPLSKILGKVGKDFNAMSFDDSGHEKSGNEGRDGGYNTANSDDNHTHSFESSEDEFGDPNGNSPLDPSPVETRRNVMEAAADTFRGRAAIPPITDSPHIERERAAFKPETRRQLRGTVETYNPPNMFQ